MQVFLPKAKTARALPVFTIQRFVFLKGLIAVYENASLRL
jgi:hypothetical protein